LAIKMCCANGAGGCRVTSGRSSSPTIIPGWSTGTTYQANQARIGTNIRPRAREPGTGALHEGCALLRDLATCGSCGRKPTISYRGAPCRDFGRHTAR
jgi:hypothetical protein